MVSKGVLWRCAGDVGVMARIVSFATSSSSTPFHFTTTVDVEEREAGTEEGTGSPYFTLAF